MGGQDARVLAQCRRVLNLKWVLGSGLIAVLATTGAAGAERLVDARLVSRGQFLAPQFAPDGQKILVTGPQMQGLHLVSLSTGSVQQLTTDAEAGVHARWSSDGTIAYRALRAGARRDLKIDRAGAVKLRAASAAIAFAKDDRLYVQRGAAWIQIGTGDRYFGERISPDGDKVVVQGLTTGLHVYVRSTGALVHIGPGTAPAWSPDSRRLVYEVTEDDGHDVVASDLYVYELATDRAAPVATEDRLIKRRPSFSPDGAKIAFDDDAGAIYVGRLEVTP